MTESVSPVVALQNVVLHVSDCERAAEFWGQALGYELLQLDDGLAVLASKDGRRPRLNLDDGDRSHLDLNVTNSADQRAAVERLIALGASPVDWDLPEDATHVVLTDPDGNHFCVVNDQND
ncbi:VOC family protein [Tenggerimyces flavus]|uniref:VOC family protein n=1 Tax=Tenggerimyces flavus TaxID=1708749 RepID=A0ABV7YI66_9ACTN|nr:VOC family protein [Tenggerimyces flavus]MBM7787517.1 catechol 2,3-dioxygenase-like lactoylglutathione lyase family enzyme [Tenggerimyces flavus]